MTTNDHIRGGFLIAGTVLAGATIVALLLTRKKKRS